MYGHYIFLKKIAFSLSRENLTNQDHLDPNKIISELSYLGIKLMGSLTKLKLINILKIFVLLNFLSLGETLGRSLEIDNNNQRSLAKTLGNQIGFHFNAPGRHLNQYSAPYGLLFPPAVRSEGRERLISELAFDQKTKSSFQLYFNSGTEVSDIKSDYILMAPSILISLLNAISQLANDNPFAPGVPRFGGSCHDGDLNNVLGGLATRFSQYIEAKKDLSRSLQNNLLLGFQHIFQNVAKFQEAPSLLSLVISEPQLRGNVSEFLKELKNCSSIFIQPIQEIDYSRLLIYQLAATTTSPTEAEASAINKLRLGLALGLGIPTAVSFLYCVIQQARSQKRPQQIEPTTQFTSRLNSIDASTVIAKTAQKIDTQDTHTDRSKNTLVLKMQCLLCIGLFILQEDTADLNKKNKEKTLLTLHEILDTLDNPDEQIPNTIEDPFLLSGDEDNKIQSLKNGVNSIWEELLKELNNKSSSDQKTIIAQKIQKIDNFIKTKQNISSDLQTIIDFLKKEYPSKMGHQV